MDVPPKEPPVWIEPLQVRSFDVDATRLMTGVSLCRCFLEAAWNHAENLGMGFTGLAGQGKFWVLSRLRLEVEEYPAWGSGATLRTWPRGITSAFALREFELLNGAGRCVAAGTSAWLIVDSTSKRPQRLHKLWPQLAALDGRAALGRDPEKLPDLEGWTGESTLRVLYSDIDVNRHVNSTRYLSWILDAYPPGFHLSHSLRVIEVNYLNETREGEQVTVRSKECEPGRFSHSVLKSDGVEACRARFEWEAIAGG